MIIEENHTTGFTVIFQLPVRHAFWEDLEEK